LRKVPRFTPAERLVFGNCETKLLNAHTVQMSDTGELLIVFNRGLLVSVLVGVNLLLYALRKRNGSDTAIYDIDEGKLLEFAPRFAHVIKTTAEGGAPAPDLTFPFALDGDEDKEVEWTLMEDAAVDFVFAHEYAHIVCRHLEQSGNSDAYDSSGRGRWGFEYQADTEALDLIGHAWAERFPGNPLWPLFLAQGVHIFFEMMLRIEQYRAGVLGDSTIVWSPHRSHPPTIVRWLRLLGQVDTRVAGPGWAQFVSAQLNTIEMCISKYFDAAIPGLQKHQITLSLSNGRLRMISSAVSAGSTLHLTSCCLPFITSADNAANFQQWSTSSPLGASTTS
jgi:hypothetical protein